jgi:hypothetical protein
MTIVYGDDVHGDDVHGDDVHGDDVYGDDVHGNRDRDVRKERRGHVFFSAEPAQEVSGVSGDR